VFPTADAERLRRQRYSGRRFPAPLPCMLLMLLPAVVLTRSLLPRHHANWTCQTRWHGNQSPYCYYRWRPGEPFNLLHLPLLSGEKPAGDIRSLSLQPEIVHHSYARVCKVTPTLQSDMCLSANDAVMGAIKNFLYTPYLFPAFLLLYYFLLSRDDFHI